MNKLYYNKTTKEYGVSFEMLRHKFPNISLSLNIESINDWVCYEQVERPTIHRYQSVSEDLPTFSEDGTNGVQTWRVTNKEVTDTFLTSLKQEIKDKVTNQRWITEGGGIVFPNGVKVKTSKDDQDRILSVIINAERNGIEEIDFKAESGWVKISLFALKQLAKELTYFVQHCFKTEKYHHGVIDSLTSVPDICGYDYLSGWVYSSADDSTEVLNLYNLSIVDVITLLYSNFIFSKTVGANLLVTKDKYTDAQALIDKVYYGVGDLIPAQFYFLLAKSGLDDAIQTLLPPLRIENITKYSKYKSYLYGARFYEFSKAIEMYTDIKAKILTVNPNLNYTVDELKTLWLEASQV